MSRGTEIGGGPAASPRVVSFSDAHGEARGRRGLSLCSTRGPGMKLTRDVWLRGRFTAPSSVPAPGLWWLRSSRAAWSVWLRQLCRRGDIGAHTRGLGWMGKLIGCEVSDRRGRPAPSRVGLVEGKLGKRPSAHRGGTQTPTLQSSRGHLHGHGCTALRANRGRACLGCATLTRTRTPIRISP